MTALSYGVASVEADVYLINGTLFVTFSNKLLIKITSPNKLLKKELIFKFFYSSIEHESSNNDV